MDDDDSVADLAVRTGACAFRAWLEQMVKAMKFVELVVAILAFITRMRDVNTELVRQLAHLRRKRPRSELHWDGLRMTTA